MEFRILGPLEVITEAGPVALGGPRPSTLLAVLLAHPGQVVSLEYLIDAVWDEHPPATARRQVQNAISALRRLVGDGRAGKARIVADGGGYLARPRPGELDSQVFADRVAKALGLAEADRLNDAVEELRSALLLWRGPALSGLTGRAVEAAAARLDEQRLTAIEHRLDLELRLGRQDAVVGDLTELVAANPLRERLVGQLMLALNRTGRQADALQVYHRLRVHLADEHGLDPGPPLRQQYTAILNNDPTVLAKTAPSVPAPRQLPADVAGFTGRREHLKRLDELLPEHDGGDTAVVIATIAGMAGIGKTALAVHWGHRVSDRFPDGQLYMDLRGHAEGEPVQPIDALAHFLRSLGVPADEIPGQESGAAARYRSLLAERRVLVLLDNAGDAAQVRPMLPAGPGCLVLVTSRHRLSGLVARDGARRVTLEGLGADEARLLLERVLGGERAAAEPEAAAELARACSYLPLALRIAAAIVLDRPGRAIGDLVAELHRDALSVLDGEDEQSGIRAAFELSYRALAPDAQRLFRIAGLAPVPDLTAQAAAALVDATPPEAGRLLERLAGANLCAERTSGRYASHDLLRRYAADRSHAQDSAEQRREALRRLFDWYLRGADAAAKLLYPDRLRLPLPAATVNGPILGTDAEALAWLDAERTNLVAAIAHAAEHGPRPVAWLLADTLRSYFLLRMHVADLARATRAALRAAEAEQDLQAQAIMLLSLSNLDHRELRYGEAIAHCTRALALAERIGWAQGEATALGILATVYREAGRLEEALRHLERALAVSREIGDRGMEAHTLRDLAEVHNDGGEARRALELAGTAVSQARELGDLRIEADSLNTLAAVHHRLGRDREAVALHERVLQLIGEGRDPLPQIEAFIGLALAYQGLAEPGQALDYGNRALTAAGGIGSRVLVDRARAVLAGTARQTVQ